MLSRVLRRWLFLWVVGTTAAVATSQTVPFFGTNVRTANGTAYTGPMQICPVGQPELRGGTMVAGSPANYAQGAGGTIIAGCVTVQVSLGGFATRLPDAWLTTPVHACFALSAQDPVTYVENLPGYVCVQPSIQPGSPAIRNGWCTVAAGCDLSKLGPLMPTLPPILAGPPGPQGQQGLPGNAGTLATPLVAGVVYTPDGSSTDTLAPASLTGGVGDMYGSAPAGAVPASTGTSGYFDTFMADIHGPTVNGACQTPGWDFVSGMVCFGGGFAATNPGTGGMANRQLQYGGSPFPQGSVYAAMGQLNFAPSQPLDEYFGFNANPITSPFADSSHDLLLTASQAGFGVRIGSTTTVLWNTNGNSTGVRGITDSGYGGGYTQPAAGQMYAGGLFAVDAHNLIASFMLPGTTQYSAAFRVYSAAGFPSCASPCGGTNHTGLQNFVTHVSQAADRVANLAMASDRFPTGTAAVLIPHGPGHTNSGAVLPFSIHADGSECLYDGSEDATKCQKIVVWLPPIYVPGTTTRWAMVLPGAAETPFVALNGVLNQDNPGGHVADQLHQAGYVLVGMEFPQGGSYNNCYGSPVCSGSLVNVAALVHHYFPGLAPQPYLLGISQGCLPMLTAVAHGLFAPPAMAGFSCNTNLNWAAYSGGSGGPQMPYIEQSFGFTIPQQYDTATAGYDPQFEAAGQGTSFMSAAQAHLFQARLMAVPTQLVADLSGDAVVDQSQNTQLYVNTINAAHPGTATFYDAGGGGHVGAQEMNGYRTLTFFNAH